MAREVVINITCDWHKNERDVRIEGQGFTVTFGAIQYDIDLCGPCIEEFADPLREVVEKYGEASGPGVRARRKARPSETPTEGIACPLCQAVQAHRHSLGSHLRKAHDTNLGEIEKRGLLPHGAEAKRRGRKGQQYGGDRSWDGPRKCPECDWMTSSPQGMGAHRKAKHGVVGTSKSAGASRERQEQLEGT
jgi:uncharacterized C2H2 Zn-finger protein